MPEVITSYDDVDFSKYCVLQSQGKTPQQTKEFKVSLEAAKMSLLFRDILGDAEGKENIIPVPDTSSETLELVLEYMEYHVKHPAKPLERPLRSRIDELVDEWDQKFLFDKLQTKDNGHAALFEVMQAANFLNINDLLDLTCGCVASMIRGKTAEEIREMFKIEKDFQPGEEEKIKEENGWCAQS
eukprot:gene2493-1553_t